MSTDTFQATTPMLKQYQSIKSEHEDAILFFRLGDFYEMFLEDAKVASQELNLTLTGRGKDENRIPMCGFPYHSSENYITKLVSKGHKVAICEQVEDPNEAQGITKREVVQIISPGTILADAQLDAQEHNYLAAIHPIKSKLKPKKTKHESISYGVSFGFSFLDISTGGFYLCTCQNNQELHNIMATLTIKEVLIPHDTHERLMNILHIQQTGTSPSLHSYDELILSLHQNYNITPFEPLDSQRAQEELSEHFNLNSLSALGIESESQAYGAAYALLQYASRMQKTNLQQISTLKAFQLSTSLRMDPTTLKNLELTDSPNESKSSKAQYSTLFSVLNDTKTAMGARQLKSLMKTPYYDKDLLHRRLDALTQLHHDILSREEIRDSLSHVYDLERLISRVVSHHHNPKDLLALKHTLQHIQVLSDILHHLDGEIFKEYAVFFKRYKQEDSDYTRIIHLIDSAIIDDAPAVIRDGNIIKEGFSDELDTLKHSFKDIKHWIASLEAIERDSTGIKTLKVGYNKVFGYFFSIPNSQKDHVPDHYIRKQTLTNAERYVTPELKEKESVLLHGEEQQKALEIKLYTEIIEQIAPFIKPLQKLADIISDIDCIQSLASVSQRFNYTRPEFCAQSEQVFHVAQSRHPVIERNASVAFIPNDIEMSFENNRTLLITGPNMAGKSTLMRQAALIVIMAQMGCYVPASSAKLSLVDQLFTRIGALDNLYFGQSTFMVEMLETSNIVHNATCNSLIILDEVGRGTSTYDGMSIACAVTEHIHTQIKARTFFATHYHELTYLSERYTTMSNFHLDITEDQHALVFTYLFKPGRADRSYGVHVAKMAGLPPEIIQKAMGLMSGFEQDGIHYLQENYIHQLSLFKS